MAKRGCGERQRGGVYLETFIAPPGGEGTPLEAFIVDPPIPVDPQELGVSGLGVTFTEDGHILDWVGSNNYPNIADFLEEGRVLGFSRRISKGLDLSKLAAKPKLLLIHSRGHIVDPTAYYAEAIKGRQTIQCPKKNCEPMGFISIEEEQSREGGGVATLQELRLRRKLVRVIKDDKEHIGYWPHAMRNPCSDEMCAGLYWRDLELEDNEPGEAVNRTLPCGANYRGHIRPDGPKLYEPAIFLVLPIHAVAVVKAPDDPAMEAAAVQCAARFPGKFRLVDE